MTLTPLMLLTGCGDDDSKAESKGTQLPTTQPRDLQAEVLASYRASWDAFTVAADPPNPEYPALAEFKTGTALAVAQQSLTRYRERGQVVRGNTELNPRVISVTSLRAEVEDCVLDQSALLDVSGRVVEAPTGGRERWRAVLVATDGRWKTEDMRTQGEAC